MTTLLLKKSKCLILSGEVKCLLVCEAVVWESLWESITKPKIKLLNFHQP